MNRRWLLIKLPEVKAHMMKSTYIPPLGLWQLRDYLINNNDTVDVVDLHLVGYDTLNTLDLKQYTHVGISAQFSSQHDFLIQTISYIRDTYYPLKIYVGGFHAVYAKEYIPNSDSITFVKGGGPEYFGAIPPYLKSGFSKIEMEPYWELNKPHDLQAKTSRWFPFETSRGCPFTCGFCGVGQHWGTSISSYDIEERFNYLLSQGITELFMEDDNLLQHKETFQLFTNLCNRNNIVWSTPNGVSIKYLLKYLQGDNLDSCWRISLPFETGVKNTADIMNMGHKYTPFEVANNLVTQLKDKGIKTCGFFIIGYPGESKNDIKETLSYANSLPLDQRNIYIATPYPGSKLYNMCIQNNYLRYTGEELFSRLGYTTALIDTPEWTAEDIQEIRDTDRRDAIARKA